MSDEVVVPDVVLDSTPIVEENTDAPSGTENIEAEPEGQDGEKNETVVDVERQKSDKKISGIQKRLNELTRDKYAERQARETLEKQNRDLMELLKGGVKPVAHSDGKPQQDQYTDFAEFVKADAVWSSTQAAKAHIEQYTKTQQEASQRQSIAQSESAAAAAYAQRAAATAKSVPDFDEVMAEADVDVPMPVLSMIRQLDNGPLVAYHMVKNPALAQKFITMHPSMHGVLLGQLSATLKGSAKVSNAPPPGAPAKQRASSSNEAPADTDEYMAWADKKYKR